MLSSSTFPKEEILVSWRHVGFLAGKIRPCGTSHLLRPMQTLTKCMGLQHQSCQKGNKSVSGFHMEKSKEMKLLSAEALKQVGQGGKHVELQPRAGGRTSSASR